MLAFTLDGLAGHYELLAGRLLILGAKRNCPSTWTLRTAVSIDAIRADLGRYMHPTDTVTIVELAPLT